MFGFLKREKTNVDPLSNLQTVSRWMQDMPAGDIYTALGTVIENLIRFNQMKQPVSKDRLQVLMHLDENARDIHATLCAQYLRNPRMSKEIETRMWSSINAFYWETTRGYHAFLMDYVNDPGGSKIQSHIPTITARGIRGLANLFKWKYIRYEKADERLWLRLHNLYRISEFEVFHEKPSTIYSSDAKPSTCANEYLQALLIAAIADGGGCNPRQIEIVDSWLDAWTAKTEISSIFDKERHYFFVDTAQGRGMSAVPPPEVHKALSTTRYLNTGPLLEHLSTIENSIRSGVTPATVGLGEDFRLPDGYEMLERAAIRWSFTTGRERRRSERIPCDSNLAAVREMEAVHHMFALYGRREMQGGTQDMTPEEILDIKIYGFVTERTKAGLQQSSKPTTTVHEETWQLFDQSRHGIGALAHETKPMKNGTLVAVRKGKQDEWQAGVVRRIARQRGSANVIIGLELKACNVTAITLSEEDEHAGIAIVGIEETLKNARTNIKALHLHDPLSESKYILMPSSHYANGRRYKFTTHEIEQWVRLDSVVDKGDGWIEAAYLHARESPIHEEVAESMPLDLE